MKTMMRYHFRSTEGHAQGLPWCLSRERVSLQCKRPRFDPWVLKIPGERNGYPLQYSCLENSIDRGAWQALVHGHAKSQT